MIEFEVVPFHGAGIEHRLTEDFCIRGRQIGSEFPDLYGRLPKRLCLPAGKRVRSVAMEATGIYWMSLYAMLELHGIKVCLVHLREVQQVKGRKTDVKDSHWIQRLYSAGLLRESIVAEGLQKELRMLVRERGNLIGIGSLYVNKMQKYLELMNSKLRNVLSRTHGKSGLKIICALLSGERNTERLMSLCYVSIRDKHAGERKKALAGHYNERYPFLLGENLRLWEEHQPSVRQVE
jgi:hypothetical protein